jgi:methyl-accepting chemotaxis protein
MQVDTVTQRNASTAEELSSTSEELAAQASSLNQLVSFFRLEDDTLPPRAAKPQPRAAAGGDKKPSPAPSGDFQPFS